VSAVDPRYDRCPPRPARRPAGVRTARVGGIVAGAQAVYLRTGAADLAVAPFTTDGDIALDPDTLGDDPALETAMRAADFERSLIDGPSTLGSGSPPPSSTGRSSSSLSTSSCPKPPHRPADAAALGYGHDRSAARRAVGLEAALVDHSSVAISALDPADGRVVHVEVAGAAALLVAKAHKLHDRLQRGRVDRLVDKDAADVLRLMQSTRVTDVAATMRQLMTDARAGAVTTSALGYLDEAFGRRGRPGTVMAARALRLALAPEAIEALCVAYTGRMTRELG